MLNKDYLFTEKYTFSAAEKNWLTHKQLVMDCGLFY